jgi:PAS domain S-box-containing protein
MTQPLLVVSAVEALGAVTCLAVAVAAWQYRSRPGGTPLVVLGVAGSAWATTAALASTVVDPTLTLWAQRGTYASVGVAAVCWFYLVVEYTRRTWWQRTSVLTAVGSILAVDWLVIATDPIHHRIIAESTTVGPAGVVDPTPGVLLWVSALWKAAMLVAGIAIVVVEVADRRGVYRAQSSVVLVTGVLPLGAAVVELFDLYSVPGLDISVLGVVASSVIALWALFYADFLDVVPVARRTLFESMKDAVVAVNAQGRVVDINESARRLFDTGGAVLGSEASAVLPDEARACAAGESTEVVFDRDGDRRRYEVAVSPISPDRGPDRYRNDELGRLLVLRDVTERHRQQQELEAQNDRLEEFSTVLSHDLRNPLSVAQGYLTLARETGDTADFDAVDRALGRMDDLVGDLLALARTGESVYDSEDVDLADLVSECWANVVTDGATLVVTTDLTVRAERGRLKQLVENLFRNAVEHGGRSVTVSVGDLPDGSGFYVADDGPGIPVDEREKVFRNGYSGQDNGTGLGLAIVERVAGIHGWEVRLTDSEDGGARFEFRIDA